jgi:large subunit ribosomal protein L10
MYIIGLSVFYGETLFFKLRLYTSYLDVHSFLNKLSGGGYRMAISKHLEIKAAKISEIKEKLQKSQAAVFSKYQGLTVEEDTNLRKQLRDSGIEYKVYKNTLTTLAANELGFGEATKFLVGPISIAFGYEDVTAPARILNNFAKEHKKLQLQGGLVQGVVYDVDKIKKLATIPSREVLIAKLLGSFKSPISNFAYVLNAIKEKKENESAQ